MMSNPDTITAVLAGVVVPLVWRESSEGYASGQWFADSIFGEYCTWMHKPSGQAWLQGPDSLGDFVDSIDAAKVAAQAHYAAKVLSTLDTSIIQGLVDGLIEANRMCGRYAEFIRHQVKVEDIECHPYLPELEQVIEDANNALSAISLHPHEPEGRS